MAKFSVMLARLVRETSTFSVEAPTIEEAKAKAQAVYDNDGAENWEPDFVWGEEEGTHYIVTPEGERIPFSGDADDEVDEL